MDIDFMHVARKKCSICNNIYTPTNRKEIRHCPKCKSTKIHKLCGCQKVVK